MATRRPAGDPKDIDDEEEIEESIEVDVQAAIFQRFSVFIRLLEEVLTGQHGAR